MTHLTGLLIESLVAVLLLLTIAYCIVLNRRLQRLKADEQSLKATIAELITATEIAERAIGGLKHTVRECNENLGNKISTASELSARLGQQLSHGEDVLLRVSKIAMAARVQPPREQDSAIPASTPKSIAAAAQAFSERRRASGIAA